MMTMMVEPTPLAKSSHSPEWDGKLNSSSFSSQHKKKHTQSGEYEGKKNSGRKAERIWSSKNSQKIPWSVFMNGRKHKKKLQCKHSYDEKLGEIFLSFCSTRLSLSPVCSSRNVVFRCCFSRRVFRAWKKRWKFSFLVFHSESTNTQHRAERATEGRKNVSQQLVDLIWKLES